MSIRKKAILCITLFSVLVCSFLPLNVGAITLTHDVVYQDSGSGQLYFNAIFNDTSYNTGWRNSSYTFSGNYNLNSIAFRRSNNTAFTLNSGWFLTATMYVNFKGNQDKWNTNGLYSISNSSVSCPIIDIDDTMVETHVDGTNTDQRYTMFITCKYTGTGDARMNLFIRTNNDTRYNITFNAVGYTIWSKAPAAASASDVEAVANAVNSMKNTISNKLDTTNNKLDAVKSALDDLQALQEQANDDAQDRYEQEKAEEQEREEQGQADSEQAQSMFNFSVLNPFAPIFNMFSSSCSVNIPIIAGWLNAPSTTYTSWWCTSSKLQNIKSTLTPVFSIAVAMLIFGFVINWLRNNGSGGGVQYEDNSPAPINSKVKWKKGSI